MHLSPNAPGSSTRPRNSVYTSAWPPHHELVCFRRSGWSMHWKSVRLGKGLRPVGGAVASSMDLKTILRLKPVLSARETREHDGDKNKIRINSIKE